MDELAAFRLRRHGGKFADFLKTAGRQLPAGVAVDACRINEEVAGDIRVETFFRICHELSLPATDTKTRLSDRLPTLLIA
jgi:hypothetical protein